jgi:hypothetical protein
MANDDILSDDAVSTDDTNPLAVAEEATEKEQTLSEPEGLEDPGFVDDANWQAEEVERGVDRGDKEEDLNDLGMHVEDTNATVSGLDEDLDSSSNE